jgi:hypothetical protein
MSLKVLVRGGGPPITEFHQNDELIDGIMQASDPIFKIKMYLFLSK